MWAAGEGGAKQHGAEGVAVLKGVGQGVGHSVPAGWDMGGRDARGAEQSIERELHRAAVTKVRRRRRRSVRLAGRARLRA